jgi:hypothetical protein
MEKRTKRALALTPFAVVPPLVVVGAFLLNPGSWTTWRIVVPFLAGIVIGALFIGYTAIRHGLSAPVPQRTKGNVLFAILLVSVPSAILLPRLLGEDLAFAFGFIGLGVFTLLVAVSIIQVFQGL